ncbi:MAG TPA: hypothetical protein VI485_20115 [Vicinamibacterales bacterium]|nr:hypothetical protein [Vicinamibacterales bacterium]
MNVRVETLDRLDPLVGSSSRLFPALRTITAAATVMFTSLWHRQSSMVMSEEWMKEHRWTSRIH